MVIFVESKKDMHLLVVQVYWAFESEIGKMFQNKFSKLL